MVDLGSKACFMKDNYGRLPAHVACSRHVSPDKLKMLLAVNPGVLFIHDNNGHDLLGLALYHATKTYPSYALIAELMLQIKNMPKEQSIVVANSTPAVSSDDTSEVRDRLDSSAACTWSWQEPNGHSGHLYDIRHGCDDGVSQGQTKPIAVPYQTLQNSHAPRLQPSLDDQSNLAPFHHIPSGSAGTVSSSRYFNETEKNRMEHPSECVERFQFHDHSSRVGDPTLYNGDWEHGRHHGAPALHPHEHQTDHSKPISTGHPAVRNERERDVLVNVTRKFQNRRVETTNVLVPTKFRPNAPRLADLPSHVDFGQPQPNDAPPIGRKRKGIFVKADEPIVPDAPDVAGAYLLLHFFSSGGAKKGPADKTLHQAKAGKTARIELVDLLSDVNVV
jgi:hypothetical protein